MGIPSDDPDTIELQLRSSDWASLAQEDPAVPVSNPQHEGIWGRDDEGGIHVDERSSSDTEDWTLEVRAPSLYYSVVFVAGCGFGRMPNGNM